MSTDDNGQLTRIGLAAIAQSPLTGIIHRFDPSLLDVLVQPVDGPKSTILRVHTMLEACLPLTAG
jgi:hypothetical protein